MQTMTHRIAVRSFLILAVLTVWTSETEALRETGMPYASRVTDGRFPAVVRLWFPGHMGLGSGVLITPRHVLTAAHVAPTDAGEVRDSAWHESHGGDARDVEHSRFSFLGTSEPEPRPDYRAGEYFVHPNYDPALGAAANWDVMILVADEAVPGVEPVPVMPRRNPDHLERGAWVRHVSFGPTEGAGAHQYKTTLLTRTLRVNASPFAPTVDTWGEAGGGDSGSPVFQQRVDDFGRDHEVLVGVLTNAGIRSAWINEEIYSWIRSVVGRIDPGLLPDDYDGDGLLNLDDDCLMKTSRPDDADTDGDGVGEVCDFCPAPNGGQFDTNGDGAFNQCDPCPFPSSYLRFNDLTITTLRGYWSRNPVCFVVGDVESDGRWLEEEYATRVTVGSRTWGSDGLEVSIAPPEGRRTAQVRIWDGCGLQSARHFINFGVDDTEPTVYFRHPPDGSIISRNSTFTVEVAVGDMLSGIGSVELSLDDLPGEFSEGRKLCDFHGPWMIGFLTTDRCEVVADFTYGEHTLYVAATDGAGNTSYASRNIWVSLAPVIQMPTLPPPGEPAPMTPTPTSQAAPTATPTSTPTACPPTPTPTRPALKTPTPAAPSPVYRNPFKKGSLIANDIIEFSGTFAGLEPAAANVVQVPASIGIGCGAGGHALHVTAAGNQGTLLVFGTGAGIQVNRKGQINLPGGPKILVRACVQVSDPSTQVFLGVIDTDAKGDLTAGGGGLGLEQLLLSRSLESRWRAVSAVHESQSGFIKPFVQVVGSRAKAEAYIDNVEVYVIPEGEGIPDALLW